MQDRKKKAVEELREARVEIDKENESEFRKIVDLLRLPREYLVKQLHKHGVLADSTKMDFPGLFGSLRVKNIERVTPTNNYEPFKQLCFISVGDLINLVAASQISSAVQGGR
jgi:hypothetical protein